MSEGGALETDGHGTLLATESSLVNANRNPGLGRAAVEAELRRTLAAAAVIWLPGVRAADPTDCHVDALARFARPAHIFGAAHRPAGPPALSYVNYLLVNGGLILPQFADAAADAAARETMARVFGDKEIVPVTIRELPNLGGGIHCATQEVPMPGCGWRVNVVS